MPQNHEHVEQKSDAPQKGADAASAKLPAVEAQHRVASITKRVDGMRATVAQRDMGPATLNQQLDAAGLRVVQSIEEKANALKKLVNSADAVGRIGLTTFKTGAAETLSSVMDMLRAEPSVRTTVTPSFVDALVTIGKANKDSTDPTVQADVDELRRLVIELQGQLKKQADAGVSGMPSIVINNNLGPQAGPQAQAPVAPEKKEEQQGWQEEGLSLMRQVASINQRIATLKRERQGAQPDPVAEKAFKDEVDGLISMRKQLLRSANSVVENARKPSPDRHQIAATKEETVKVMNEWLLSLGSSRGGLGIKDGLLTVF